MSALLEILLPSWTTRHDQLWTLLPAGWHCSLCGQLTRDRHAHNRELHR